ncbi:CSS-motif domain-containing protein [Vibrio furnissii]|uniref:CSS-motif domain-containing protein n=1 Tax=Vibrio furnissii TaxID=29494 RepID=UPI001F553418|nr:CSS-motif domain-containing protein [Vibrio furnissii]
MANQALTRLAIFLAAFIITLGLIEVTAYSVQKDEQIRFAHEVLREAEDASEQITDALTVTNTIAEPSCDTATMTVIRQLVHENSEIYDIGFMNDESVLCTANWGQFPPSISATNSKPHSKAIVFTSKSNICFPSTTSMI